MPASLRIAVVFPPMLLGGRPIDLKKWKTDPRGATGSETMVLEFTQCLSVLGHHVDFYIERPSCDRWENVHVFDLGNFQVSCKMPNGGGRRYDVVICALDVNFFRFIEHKDGKPLRVVLQQINGFEYGQSGFEEHVDLFASPSGPHRDMLIDRWPMVPKEKWAVVPNGVSLADYDIEEPPPRIPGRVVYASSPDRGLHWLLQEWPAIKRAAPHASLRVFYYSLGKWLNEWRGRVEGQGWEWEPWHREHKRRAAYIDQALHVLRLLDVEVVGAVSKRTMAENLLSAEVLAYPCDVVAWTEGFSCMTMEGCASGCLPVITDVDALGAIYGGSCPMVNLTPGKNLRASEQVGAWRDLVIRALTDKPWADEWRTRARTLAEKHSWTALAEKLAGVITNRIEAPR